MSKAREWRVIYKGRYDTAISFTGCMPYRKAQSERVRLKRDYGGWAKIVLHEKMMDEINAYYWADALHGGVPPIA
jgi:hypothetical protein